MHECFEKMEGCFKKEDMTYDEWEKIISEAVMSEDFFVRYSAAVAIGMYGSAKHFPMLENLLKAENEEPLYTQPAGLKNTDAAAGDNEVDDIVFPDGTTEQEKQAWQLRGKIKQAVCLSVLKIGQRENVKPAKNLCAAMCGCAENQNEDYSVRAAAVKALGALCCEECADTLRKAENDPEWCTHKEAEKALNGIKPSAEKLVGFEFNDELNQKPFYIDDIDGLRKKILNTHDEFISQLWSGIKHKAKQGGYPWFEPFAAIISDGDADYPRAVVAVKKYAASLENLRYNPGVHFHSWCFAFPHARWALYLQWLYASGAVSTGEAVSIAEKFTAHQFMYYYSCFRVKPYPETADNQTLSLAISCALTGYIFGNPPFNSKIAQMMFCESIDRVEFVLGEMGKEGYSGEGSTYMNHVIASCIPFGTELLERIYKKDCFEKCRSVSETMAREIMPDGLALPWDHYGYILPTLQCLSYNARRTNEKKYTSLLKNYTDYAFSVITGWGFDDLVWTLIWYHDGEKESKPFDSWYMKDIAACIVSENMELAAVQMFDNAREEHIARFHCNPNALILSAYGTPLLTEGVPCGDCGRFKFSDTEKSFGFMSIEKITVNDGYGCVGAHSAIVVDGYEAMRPRGSAEQIGKSEVDAKNKSIYADVTPIYRQNFPDAVSVTRRCTLVNDAFWLIEDEAEFENEHDFTMRLIARSSAVMYGNAVITKTPEYTGMYIKDVYGGGKITLETVEGYPNTLDKKSVIIDNTKHGKKVKWCHMIMPYDEKNEAYDITDGWSCVSADTADISCEEAEKLLIKSVKVPLKAPAYFFTDTEDSGKWVYCRKIKNPGNDFVLRLPHNLHNASLWVNKKEYKIPENGPVPSYVRIADACGNYSEIILYTETGTAQYKDKYDGGGFFGKAAVYTLKETNGGELEQKAERLIKCINDGSIE